MHVVGAPEPAPPLCGVSNIAGASAVPVPFLPPQPNRIVSTAMHRKLVAMLHGINIETEDRRAHENDMSSSKMRERCPTIPREDRYEDCV